MSLAPAEALEMIRSLVPEGSYDPKLLETIINGKSRWTGCNTVRPFLS